MSMIFKGTLNRSTQIHNRTTLNTCNISNNVNTGSKHEKGGSRSDTIGLRGGHVMQQESWGQIGMEAEKGPNFFPV